ncbi:general stress protein [Enterococcus sp. HMSC29A04]|uniref:Asp23/Gls24 family envelope stress response protein n=1 Tax=Enterococcus TaxID=1350 RepID=UPI0007F3872C|nr:MULTISPECIES: Asp23/Gls24 family envelope stress response protein [Enterococcus]MDT2570156.1 Asp23/Gls24 family envelope stress response protein [Enterococcus raffinosus]OFT87677.1 general stress protein [Enterococcus sp. HMSC29A04]QXJ61536.1 Asp23/Gls24 family envelope stress response protein [Enterococcus raffinosus]SAZ40351.1 alkaline shock protein 23 family protein [Enterococcus faecium]
MVENYENKNVNGQAVAESARTNQSNVQTDQEVKGDLVYDDKVIQKIIGIAIEQIDGLLTVDGGIFSNAAEKLVNTDNVTAGIDTEVGKEQVAVDMDVVIEYGKDITKVASEIRKVIRDEVAKMTHLDVIEVNLHVVDIKTKEEFEQDSETVQDKVTSAAKTTGEFASKQSDKAKDAVNRGTDKVQEKIEENQDSRVK